MPTPRKLPPQRRPGPLLQRPSGDLPLRNTPDYGKPFGPYPTPETHSSDVHRSSSGVVDMRGAVGWRPVFSVDCGEYSSGQILVTCEAQASPTVANAKDLQVFPWVEVRISGWVNGQSFVLLEAAASGPIFLAFQPGEVPDKIDVQARARRGGKAETAGDPDEKLNLMAAARFHS